MDFLDFGKPENDDGEWETVEGREVRIRPMSVDQARKIEERYGKEERLKGDDGRYRVERVYSAKDTVQVIIDKADFVWVDMKDCNVTPGDDDAVRFWADAIGHDVTRGERISLTGRLNSKMKRRLLLMTDPRGLQFAGKLIEKASSVAAHRSAIESEALGN